MSLTLGFDTSAAHVTAALVDGGDVLASTHLDMARGQGDRLMPILEELVFGQGVAFSDLDRIGVGIGPGNFTGIRISVAAARGLSMSLSIPAIGVSTHAALAYQTSGLVRTAIDARRDHVYVQDFSDGHTVGPPALHALADLPPGQARRIIGSGAGSAARGEAISDPPCQLSVAIALIARDADPGPPPAPLYIRAPDAAPSGPANLVILPDDT